MSVESRRRDGDMARPLRNCEKALLIKLLSGRGVLKKYENDINNKKVLDMDDGGMGGIRFASEKERCLGGMLVEAEYIDEDGVMVNIVINTDDLGDLYEMDFWKVDFSSLKKYPMPELVKLRK